MINTTIPKGSRLAIIGGIFKGVLNDPTAGKYDFTNYKNTALGKYNFAVDLGLKMSPNYLYFFHQFNFSMSIDEAAFLNAIDAGTVPVLKVKDTADKTIIPNPLRIFRYFESAAIDYFHHNASGNGSIAGEFQCVLNDTADLVGIDTIYAQVSMSVYEITDNKFIENFKRENR